MATGKEQEQLDVEVVTTRFGIRCVQWDERALGGSPLYAPGRFLAPPDDAMGHLCEDAAETSRLHEHAVAKVPEYSGDEWCAFMAADAELAEEPGYAARGPGERPVGVERLPGRAAWALERPISSPVSRSWTREGEEEDNDRGHADP